MRIQPKLLAVKSRPPGGGRGAALLVLVLLLAGVLWLLRREGYLGGTRARQASSAGSVVTNAPAPRVPTNPPSGRPLVSTVLVTRPAFAVGTTNASVRSNGTLAASAVLDAQIALDRLAFSSGSIDGVNGSQTRAAVRAFQTREGLATTGELDADTRARITLTSVVLTRFRAEASDAARLLPLGATWLAKSQQPRLDYESMLELAAERHHAHPNLLRRLNPAADWNAVLPGAELVVPSVERERPATKAAYLQIRLAARTLQAFDANHRLLAHFPCSIAARMDKRPVGELHVAVVIPNPDYTFNPELFPESAEARELKTKLVLPPGPNNPVGTAWIGLNLPGYGIHGTPKPEDVGRTESHGCFRLANWNAEYLLQLVAVGTVVRVEP